ncbi:MAG: DNA primase [Alphaproteobacteria bacterium]
MVAIPNEFLERLRESVRIEDVVRARIRLKKAGHDYKGLCPFHQEKTPSFHVIPHKQFFHCFGCGASGDVIKFVQDFDKGGFLAAVKTLADLAGLPIPKAEAPPPSAEETRYFTLYEQATAFYHHTLAGDAGGQRYLQQRGIHTASVKQFSLGLAPDAWDSLSRFLTTRDHRPHDMAEAGLCVQKDPKRPPFDRFRHRLMFPIHNRQGKVVAFGGRTLPGEALTEHADAPKYLNSPETEHFQKNRMLYGLFQALPTLRKTRRVTVVEGYTDVILLHQHGYTDAVAPLGTAFTEMQMTLLWSLVDQMVVCFDGDAAGMRAAERCIQRMLPDLRPEKSVAIMMMDAGEDPASLMAAGGQARWDQMQTNALSILDFWMRIHRQGLDGSGHERAALMKTLLGDCDAIRDPDLRAFYKQDIRDRFYQARTPPSRLLKKQTVGVVQGPLPSPKGNLDRVCCALLADLAHHPEWLEDAAELLGHITFPNPAIEEIRAHLVDRAVQGVDKSPEQPYINPSEWIQNALQALELWKSDAVMPPLFLKPSHDVYNLWHESCLKLKRSLDMSQFRKKNATRPLR